MSWSVSTRGTRKECSAILEAAEHCPKELKVAVKAAMDSFGKPKAGKQTFAISTHGHIDTASNTGTCNIVVESAVDLKAEAEKEDNKDAGTK